eukprot:g12672.t1
MQPDALPKLPNLACKDCHRSCAPDVKIFNGVYYMYFLAYHRDEGHKNCIFVAKSNVATGPYEPYDDPIVCDTQNSTAMDPRVFEDKGGEVFLFFGSHGSPIVMGQLDLTRTKLLSGTKIAAVLPDTSSYGRVVEAPWVYIDKAGALTMFYSGSQCCGKNAHYSVMAARSGLGPRGPWEKLGGASGETSVVLKSELHGHVTNPGHNAVVTDDAGQDWILYHANEGGQCNSTSCPRKLYLDRLYYNRTYNGLSNWPWTAGPTYRKTVAPTIKEKE